MKRAAVGQATGADYPCVSSKESSTSTRRQLCRDKWALLPLANALVFLLAKNQLPPHRHEVFE